LGALEGWADEIVVVDSQSTDSTIKIAESFKVKVLQFYYQNGWPKKRQWALNSYHFRNSWILLLDADEILLSPIKDEIADAIKSNNYEGYWLRFHIFFLGRQLKYGDTELWKLFLFRQGKGRYEKRLEEQDTSMSDIEVHEHVIVEGKTSRLKNPIRHENFNTLDRYIQKHNQYSNWEARLYSGNPKGEIKASLFGSQPGRRRFLKKVFLNSPFFPILLFLYRYFFKLGFLDGKPGLFYCCFQAIQAFHLKAKIYEIRSNLGQSFIFD